MMTSFELVVTVGAIAIIVIALLAHRWIYGGDHEDNDDPSEGLDL